MTLPVDDCTGWAITSEFGVTGAAGTVYDTGQQETMQVTAASATSGPGTLTLASALTFGHGNGTMVTTLPQSRDLGDDPVRERAGPHPRVHIHNGPQHPRHRVQRGEECRGTRRAG